MFISPKHGSVTFSEWASQQMGLGFMGRTISLTTTQLCGCRVKGPEAPSVGVGVF